MLNKIMDNQGGVRRSRCETAWNRRNSHKERSEKVWNIMDQ
jgi:hypothetical protein